MYFRVFKHWLVWTCTRSKIYDININVHLVWSAFTHVCFHSGPNATPLAEHNVSMTTDGEKMFYLIENYLFKRHVVFHFYLTPVLIMETHTQVHVTVLLISLYINIRCVPNTWRPPGFGHIHVTNRPHQRAVWRFSVWSFWCAPEYDCAHIDSTTLP